MLIRRSSPYVALFGVVLSGLILSASAQQADRPRQLTQPVLPDAKADSRSRQALVIGNGNYQNAPRLSNPVNDARDVASTLRGLGFQVVEKEDQTADQMKRLIKEFGENLSRGGGVGLFYFAGHGVQVNGKNYLIPVEARSLREKFIEFDAVDVGRVLTEMEDAENGPNIVILDACRSNPFTRSWRSAEAGLAQIGTPSGTFIAYATAPGSVADDGNGSNGLYTSELVRLMKQPGLTIEEMFKRVRRAVRERSGGRQIPTESSMLFGDFYFAAAGETSLRNKAMPNVAVTGTTEHRVSPPPVKSARGAKSGKVVFWYGVIAPRATSTIQEIFSGIDEFLPSFITALKQEGVDVITSSTQGVRDRDQVTGVVLQIENGAKASTRSVPYALAITATFMIEDRPPFQGMNITVATITLKAFDLEKGEIVAIENISESKGFGLDKPQALRNAVKEAISRIPHTFIGKVASEAK
ncbi:MAG TPA: caspase family protein [Pyrinomonadaceae bacterium]|nr:caspase family protein [Pyrinomonadaceae bacterium]